MPNQFHPISGQLGPVDGLHNILLRPLLLLLLLLLLQSRTVAIVTLPTVIIVFACQLAVAPEMSRTLLAFGMNIQLAVMRRDRTRFYALTTRKPGLFFWAATSMQLLTCASL